MLHGAIGHVADLIADARSNLPALFDKCVSLIGFAVGCILGIAGWHHYEIAIARNP